MMEHVLTTYVRTKTVFKHRLKDLKDYSQVKIYKYELEKLDVNANTLRRLKSRGELWFDAKGNFKALKEGPVNPKLLELTMKKKESKRALNDTHRWMRDQLKLVELDADESEIPVYFKTFLKHRDTQLDLFFSIDNFAGRVHTPVVNLKHDLRGKIKLDGSNVISLDVKQMQPTILAKVLKDVLGENSFSNSIFKGEDVYVLIQRSMNVESRDEAKKVLFRLIFGKPAAEDNMLGGDGLWVEWINEYKSTRETKNPHGSKTHTNLAWLLQYSEVQVMSGIWRELAKQKIPFLSIHDDILCKPEDREAVHKIMDDELKLHFPSYSITFTDLSKECNKAMHPNTTKNETVSSDGDVASETTSKL